MSGTINIRTLVPGTVVMLTSGAEAEIVSNPQDGVWLFVRLTGADTDEEMVFAQDVVEIRP